MASPGTVYGAESNIPNILGILRFAVLMVVTLLRNCDVSITSDLGCIKFARQLTLLRDTRSSCAGYQECVSHFFHRLYPLRNIPA